VEELKYVITSPELIPVVKPIEDKMEQFFSHMELKPKEGGFLISNERYVMYRASSMSIFLRKELEKIVGSGAEQAIYRFGKACGSADAKFFVEKLNLQSRFERIGAGPVHFAFGGYAVVQFLPETNITDDDECLFVYDHPNSYEADSYIQAKIECKHPVCQLNAGYSAGWVFGAEGLHLDAKEIACRAKGDAFCRFVLAPPKRLNERVKEIKEKYNLR